MHPHNPPILSSLYLPPPSLLSRTIYMHTSTDDTETQATAQPARAFPSLSSLTKALIAFYEQVAPNRKSVEELEVIAKKVALLVENKHGLRLTLNFIHLAGTQQFCRLRTALHESSG